MKPSLADPVAFLRADKLSGSSYDEEQPTIRALSTIESASINISGRDSCPLRSRASLTQSTDRGR
jgi:hypothetical protein